MQATTRGAILRGTTTTNAYGDQVDTDEVVAGYADLPLSLIERMRDVYDQSTGEARTIRKITGRLPSFVVLATGDRLRDNRTGRIYVIEESERTPRGLSGRSSLTLDLRATA